ncbi:viral A-type inclusion protein [Niabella yanshanensis]|uniref:Viral A-type inclusion protein n=1 Tax=Niabella yanshanensis TaxID=577386 RepID=A0ABZ0W047_9BACT|nr:viral A-type inclusion protein [Niabella yanshanensis]WQD36633.1 viral A-type inclusion protein [Niabella yanshanensis]
MRFYSIAFIALLATSCNSGGSADAEPQKSLSDSLLQQVLDGHDVAMPKMMKLQRLQKDAQAEIDSLKKTPGNTSRIALLDSTIKNLSYADVAMHEWMEGFKYDSLKDNEPARVDYLKIQLASVNEMKEVVLSSIAKADSVLAK